MAMTTGNQRRITDMDKIKRYCYDRVLGMIEIHPKTVIKSEQYYKSSDVSALEQKLEEAVELLNSAMDSIEDLLGYLQHDVPTGIVLNAEEKRESISDFLTSIQPKEQK